jgi:hypothetical protein
MAYKKFDDPAASGDASVRKTYGAFPNDALRRAIQSISNRVVAACGTAGTATTTFQINVGTGATCGVKLPHNVIAVINGRWGTCTAMENIYLPKGTQGSGTWVKYLVSSKHGTAATVTAGNEGASATAARLPDCPDGHVAVGYVEYCTTSGAFIRFGGGTANSYNVMTGNVANTCGTVTDWQDLLHMPYDES